MIDIIASDCAPHRRSDKETTKPSNGVTTHTVMLPLLFGAVADGKITYEQLFDKLCVKPRQRFGLPLNDESFVEYYEGVSDEIAQMGRTALEREYGYNPFNMIEKKFRMVGEVVNARAGFSSLREPETSITHLIRPSNVRLTA